MTLDQEIRTTFPNYKELADSCFNRCHDLWERPMYQDNMVFKKLKEKYGKVGKEKVTTRKQIIDLFAAENYFDGYLCALVWGNIGTYQGGRERFEKAFTNDKKDVENKIKNIKQLISDNKIGDAFFSMCSSRKNLINNNLPGLGVSFFTKILYFVGATVDCETKPLIFDVTSLQILNRLYKDEESQKVARQTQSQYVYFCNKMNILSKDSCLDLPTPGHLEAFLFNCGKCLL